MAQGLRVDPGGAGDGALQAKYDTRPCVIPADRQETEVIVEAGSPRGLRKEFWESGAGVGVLAHPPISAKCAYGGVGWTGR